MKYLGYRRGGGGQNPVVSVVYLKLKKETSCSVISGESMSIVPGGFQVVEVKT